MLKPTCKLRFVKRTERNGSTTTNFRVLQQYWEETVNLGWADIAVNPDTGVWRDVELVDDPE